MLQNVSSSYMWNKRHISNIILVPLDIDAAYFGVYIIQFIANHSISLAYLLRDDDTDQFL